MSFDLIKTLPQYLIPQHGLTTLAGCLAEVKHDKIKNYIIQRFINKYQVNMSEALIEDPTAYACFNDFFIRYLKPDCRPLASADIISPVDGCVSEIGAIEQGQLIQAKGHNYSVEDLLMCNTETAAQFVNGRFATLYLSPKDYHRVHMPMDAELISMTYMPGALFSVQPSTVRVVPRLFARNERLAVFFSTQVGPMVMVMVGATIVGAIGTRWHGDIKRGKARMVFEYNQHERKVFAQGDEMGYFKLGSTVVLLFANSTQVNWSPALKAGSTIRFGQALGDIC
ncbi:archaetidylserine decarboxylase [Fluoribacter dumoffii]|uniref:Phosphatidylserine decarboxylase proenzyme n=1 Tax=Fluoribacter dumoffii TaxID=463 RepID=A0A377GF76_9GAMM|nr:archaetidylserine decarboxylase [Fluoribacter dumoffii]KTC91457.1 phosphatidylserine decarboxylase [Fluoribacter dumoffii NY 23]MCW8417071.1 archaetidylserine decarboxylase [Fluoribacter dumoffii]MCW8455089.1 archaetidylserine decarboxylase [Fluoribacter dumoffii]MCW8460834.1 archaetidylserine decarboxylase [Fluoribacter dumoffii]MCW8484276.1 archaetidylserine decarboxylase [Fluoribacter dumoffii]